jgi:histidine triad (HIT) family protein
VRVSAGCVLCDIVDGTAAPHERIAETDRALAIMDANPAALGHALVVPKTHIRDIWDLSGEDGSAVWDLTRRVALAARDGLRPDGLTLFQANGRAGWQSVFHFHIHVVPRWEGDTSVPPWTESQGDRADIATAASLLREAIAL